MFKMLAQLWSMLAVFIAGFEKFATAFSIIGVIVEEKANTLLDETRAERQKQLAALQADIAAVTKQSTTS